MKRLLILLLTILMSVSALAEVTFVRDAPPSVTPGETFTILYQESGITGDGGLLFSDTVSGGCLLSDGKSKISTGWLTPTHSVSVTYIAAASGSCTFSGTWSYATATEKISDLVIPATTVMIGSCTDGQTLACAVGDCAGTKTCNSNSWSDCVKTDSACGASSGGGGGGCTPINTCAASTLVGKTCTNNCGQSIAGTKVESVTEPKSDNSSMYIIGGIIVVIILFVVFKKKK